MLDKPNDVRPQTHTKIAHWLRPTLSAHGRKRGEGMCRDEHAEQGERQHAPHESHSHDLQAGTMGPHA